MGDLETLLRRIVTAISKQGDKAYVTESGAILDLMTQLANENNLQGLSLAFVIFAYAKPANATYVANRIPAMISNFMIDHRGVKESALRKWANANPPWDKKLMNALRHPIRFERMVERMVSAINQAAAAS